MITYAETPTHSQNSGWNKVFRNITSFPKSEKLVNYIQEINKVK